MKNYKLIEHTADVGIRVRGKGLNELFQNAAAAMFEIIAEAKGVKHSAKKTVAIEQEAGDLEELLVNWLNELLSLSATKELIFSDFQIKKINQRHLQAAASGSSPQDYIINTEVKAATYHQLKLSETKSGWQAEVIFDV